MVERFRYSEMMRRNDGKLLRYGNVMRKGQELTGEHDGE
jgi:hypothetical protein